METCHLRFKDNLTTIFIGLILQRTAYQLRNTLKYPEYLPIQLLVEIFLGNILEFMRIRYR